MFTLPVVCTHVQFLILSLFLSLSHSFIQYVDEFNVTLSVSSFYPSSGSILTVQCLTPTSHSLTGRINVTVQVGGITYYNPTYHNGVFTQDVYVGYEEGQVVSVQCIGISEYGYCDEESLNVIVNSSGKQELTMEATCSTFT